MKFTALRLSATASTLALSAAFATPAFAQAPGTTPGDQPTIDCTLPANNALPVCQSEVARESGTAPTSDESIVVTGSRIRRPNLDSPVPITSISQQELVNQGQVSVGDALNDLPALRSTFSQQNSGRFIGTAGQNFLDLRGLGTTRTLVLVNGRRHITASPGDFIVDVDNIPQDLIERVDVVTGGESSVYGSDAIAGVVNFILKKDFEGLRIRGQSGISTYGDRPVNFISATGGTNFADNRGNVAVNLEYTHAGELFLRDRARTRRVCEFQPNPADNAGGDDDPLTGTNGIPDNIFVCGTRFPFVTTGGNPSVLISGRTVSFEPNGNLRFSDVPEQNFVPFGGTIISDDPLGGATLNEAGDLAVGRDRYMGNLLAHFDVSDALRPFIEATFVRQKVKQEGQATFFQGQIGNFIFNNFANPNVPNLTCGNPFLNQQARDFLTTTRTTCRLLNATGTAFVTDANGNFIFDPNRNLPLNRYNVDFGPRKERDRRDTYRIVGGIQGDFNTDWHYEVSANYGHFKSDIGRHNELLFGVPGSPAGFALAVDAVRDPNTGQIVCRVNSTSAAQDPAGTANDVPGCVPINLFGEGAPSQAALDFVNTTSHLFSSASEFDAIAFLSGTTGKWFSLPGGPIGFSLGAEHRTEKAHQNADPVSAGGGTFFNAFAEFAPPKFAVNEIFGELEVPIVKDLPFAHELTVSGAARFSDYNTAADKTFAWNANAVYSPVRDVRLRANRSRSVRVPTLNDLFSPASVNFEFLDDPCDQFNIANNPNFAANCAAFGVPTTVLAGSPCAATDPVGSPFHNCLANTQNIPITSAGNPNLQEEVGKSLTLGGVITPRFIPGLSLSVDYFKIKVENLIAVLSGQTILNLCFGSPTGINNQYCELLNPRTQFGLFQAPALLSAGVNFAKQTSRGIDFDAAYRHRFANGHRLDLRGIATRTIERTDFVDPEHPTFGDRILGELGDPIFSGTLIAGYGIGRFDLRYTFRYIGSMTDFAWEDTHKFAPGCDPESGQCPPFNPDIADRVNTGSVTYSDIRLGYTLPNQIEVFAGVDNVFNRPPPLGLTGSGGFSGLYSNIGRFFYAGAVVNLKDLHL